MTTSNLIKIRSAVLEVYSRYHPSMYLPRGTDENHDNASQNIRYVSQGSNRASPKYKSRALTLCQSAQ